MHKNYNNAYHNHLKKLKYYTHTSWEDSKSGYTGFSSGGATSSSNNNHDGGNFHNNNSNS